MGCGRVREQSFGIKNEQFIDAIRQYLAFHFALNAGAGNHGVQLNSKLVGELAALGEQFLRHFRNGSAFYFAINKNVIHCFIF